MWTCAMTLNKWPQFVTNNIVIIPQPPYSPDLAPCDFALFPKLKIKLRGWHFEIVSDIQNDFHGASEACKKDRMTVYIP
jgi:hypothetical protein